MKKTYIVQARQSIYYQVEVIADSIENANDIADSLTSDNFTPQDFSEFEIIESETIIKDI